MRLNLLQRYFTYVFCLLLTSFSSLLYAQTVSVEQICTLNDTERKVEVTNTGSTTSNFTIIFGSNVYSTSLAPSSSQSFSQVGGNYLLSIRAGRSVIFSNDFNDYLACELQEISVVSFCTDEEGKNKWRVENTNNQPVSITTSSSNLPINLPAAGNGTDENGNPNGSNYYYFTTSDTEESITIFYGDGKTASAVDISGRCSDENMLPVTCSDGYRSLKLSNAVSDNYHSGNSNHSIALSNFNGGGAARLTFSDNAYLVYRTDGSEAYIHGEAEMTVGNMAGTKWMVYAPFGPKKNTTVPKKELKASAYDLNDGGVNTDDWFYFVMKDGAFMREIDGSAHISMTTMPADGKYGLQIGKGANGKNVNLGASSWFFYSLNGQANTQGDFNLDLDYQCDTLKSACSVFYIDNKTDLIYKVELRNSDNDDGTTGRNGIDDFNVAKLTPYFKSPYADAHIALNVDGSKLFVFGNEKPNHPYGYFDMETEIFKPVGTINLSGGLVQAAFNPFGKLFITSTGSNEVYVFSNPEDPGSRTSYGTIKIGNTNQNINIAGADIAFDQDGSFYLATHKNGGAIYSVNGLPNYLIAKRIGTANSKGKITGLAIIDHVSGGLIYSSKDSEGMYILDLNNPNEHKFLKFEGPLAKSAWGDMSTACMTPLENCDGCYATNVVAFNQGKKKNGGDVPLNRSTTDKALGQPQESGSNGSYNFVSLGFGGSIELELPCPVYNHNKNGVPLGADASIENQFGDGFSKADFIIVETSWGKMNLNCGASQNQNYPERCLVYGKEELSDDWVLLTEEPVCRTSFIDIGPAVENNELDFVKYIKIQDATDPALHSGNADGYDVDGLIVCPELVIGAITGEGRNALVNARTNEKPYEFDFNHFTSVPDVEGSIKFGFKVYPNPTTNQETNVSLWNEGTESTQIRVFNTLGDLVLQKEVSNSTNATLNFEGIGKGMFIIQAVSGQNRKIQRIIVN